MPKIPNVPKKISKKGKITLQIPNIVDFTSIIPDLLEAMKIESIKIKGFGVSVIAFPLMLLTGFFLHPNLLKLEAL